MAGLPEVLGSAPNADLAVQSLPYRPCDSPLPRQYTLPYLKNSFCLSVLSVLFALKTDVHLENYSLLLGMPRITTHKNHGRTPASKLVKYAQRDTSWSTLG